MKKIVVFCLIIVFAMGNICFAQAAGKHNDCNTYYIGAPGMDQNIAGAPGELSRRHEGRDRRHHRHHGHHNHHRHHNHHGHDDGDDDGEDIIKGIIILGIAKEIMDD